MVRQACFDPTKIEKITPAGSRPGTQTDLAISIPLSKENAIAQDKLSFKKGIMLYTDSSGYKGNIGAAAILYFDGIKQMELQY